MLVTDWFNENAKIQQKRKNKGLYINYLHCVFQLNYKVHY